jgi:predicted phage terminase large subunit-like protein
MNQTIKFDDLDVGALTDQEQRELKAYLAEIQIRNLPVPLEVVEKSRVKFPVHENGYFVKNDGRLYSPTEPQKNFISSRARYLLIYGGRGLGKSAAGTQKALKKIALGESGAIMNPKFEDLKNSTWEEFRNWIPAKNVVPKHRYRLRPEWEPMRPFTLSFTNGAKVYVKGLHDPDSARGPNINWLWYDEGGSDVSGDGWRIAIAGVRIGHEPQAWVTSTPNGVLHWLYDFFLDEERIDNLERILEETEDLGDRPVVDVFFGTMEENKKNLDPGFYASMQVAYSGWQKEQEVEGQFVSQGGSLGDSSWFHGKSLDFIPENITISKRVRYWDLAASEKKVSGKKTSDPDKTVGTKLSHARKKKNISVTEGKEDRNRLTELPNYKNTDDVFIIENQVSGYWEWQDILEGIWVTALQDGVFVEIWVEEEPGSGGKNQVAAVKLFLDERCKKIGLPYFTVEGHRPEGDKVIRANIWFAEAREGKFYYVEGEWNKSLFRMLDGFPLMRHDDEIDSVSGARMQIAPIRSWVNIDFKKV